jgi:hypothetical protein
LRVTYGVHEAVTSGNVPAACVPALIASVPPTPPELLVEIRLLAGELLDAARRLGDAGFLDDLFGPVRTDGLVLNHVALLSSCVVLLHQPDAVKHKVHELVSATVAHLKNGEVTGGPAAV